MIIDFLKIISHLFHTDDLPLRGFIGHLEESGFLPHSHKVFLWAHLNFNIEFNGDQVGKKIQNLLTWVSSVLQDAELGISDHYSYW